MKVIRKTNLNLLIDQRKLMDVQVLRIINEHGAAHGLKAMNSPQMTELRHNPNKSFGEKMARRIEAAFDLPGGFLDKAQTPETANAAFAASKPAQNDWFFKPTMSEAAQQLAREFDLLPDLLPDGKTKSMLWGKLLDAIDKAAASPAQPSEHGSAQPAAPTAKHRRGQGTRAAKARNRT